MNDDLSGCAGYGVEMRSGRIGSVAAVLPRTGRKEPGVLVIHSDPLSCRLSAVPVDEIETVDAKHRRIVLRARRPDLAPPRTQ